LAVVRTGATLITALQLKQLNVSKSALSWLDLLANIATPQIGQCLKDRGREAIASQPQVLPTLMACLKLGPKQYDREEDEGDGNRNHSDDGFYGHCLSPSVWRA